MADLRARWVLTEDNLPQLFELVPGKFYWEPDGTVSGLSVSTPAGKVKAAFGDAIVRNAAGHYWVEAPAQRPTQADTELLTVLEAIATQRGAA